MLEDLFPARAVLQRQIENLSVCLPFDHLVDALMKNGCWLNRSFCFLDCSQDKKIDKKGKDTLKLCQ